MWEQFKLDRMTSVVYLGGGGVFEATSLLCEELERTCRFLPEATGSY